MPHISRNGRIGLGVLAVLLVGGLAVWLGGYGPQIGRFFAAEPGGYYVPICTGSGELVTYTGDGEQFPQCCGGLVPKNVPSAQGSSYCLPPQCEATYEQPQCFTTPCDPVLTIVCPSPTYSPGPGISLSVRAENGASVEDASWIIPISAGQETAVQIFVSSNPGELGLTAAHLHLRTSQGLRMTGFTLTDFHETLEPATFNPSPDNATDMTVTVGSGTQPVTGEPVVGTLTIAAAGDASGVLVLDFMGDSEMTAIGRNGNVFFGTTGARFPVVSPSPSIQPQQPGDADGDGDVDIFDYNLVVSNFGRTTTSGAIRLEGDLDRDADVDIFDYNLVVSNFGHGVQ